MKHAQINTNKSNLFKLILSLVIAVGFFSFTLNKSVVAEVIAQDSVSYVVQVKKHTNVAVINSFKKKLMAQYPDKKFVTTVQAPHYILSIGYFATEAEAAEFKKTLEKEYPEATVLPYEKK
jgi:hypothetical protein